MGKVRLFHSYYKQFWKRGVGFNACSKLHDTDMSKAYGTSSCRKLGMLSVITFQTAYCENDSCTLKQN